MMYEGPNPVTRADLSGYVVPTVADLRARVTDPVRRASVGNRWKPIHHLSLLDEITDAVEARGLKIEKESYQLSKDGHDLFGFMRFDPSTAPSMPDVAGAGGITPTLGFRHSNMQRFRLLGVHAEEVFICANGIISGDFLFGFKSTTGNVERLAVGIEEGMCTWEAQAEDAKRLIEFLSSESITSDQADQLLMEGMRRKVYAPNQLGKIDAQYRAYLDDGHAHHAAFGARNLWSLTNAVTEVAKAWPVRNVERGLKGFPRVLADAFGFRLSSALVEDAPEGDSGLAFNASRN
tara:strand:+ start:80 stop:955 length:876 start_codon:yes stop_codon:yes gene_type:complete